VLHFFLGKVINSNKPSDVAGKKQTCFQACRFSGFEEEFVCLFSVTVSIGLIKEVICSHKPGLTYGLKDKSNIIRLFLSMLIISFKHPRFD